MVKTLNLFFNHLIDVHFVPFWRSWNSLQNDSSGAKIGVKTNEISRNCTNSARRDLLEKYWSMMCNPLSIKRARQYLPRIGRNEFFMNIATKFPTMHRLSSKCNISMTVAPNHTSPRPMETNHLELSRDTKI